MESDPLIGVKYHPQQPGRFVPHQPYPAAPSQNYPPYHQTNQGYQQNPYPVQGGGGANVYPVGGGANPYPVGGGANYPPNNNVQYRYGPPPPPLQPNPIVPPPDPVIQAPPINQPPPDPLLEAVPMPQPKVNTHLSLACGLCVLWLLLGIWPAWPFIAIALCYAYNSKKLAKDNPLSGKAHSRGKMACFCSVVSLSVACVYGFAVLMAPLMYLVYWGNTTGSDY